VRNMNINKDDFDAMRKMIDSWSLKPTKILMHPETWKRFLSMDLIDLYVDLLEKGRKVGSCKEVAPNEYEIRIAQEQSGVLYGVYRFKPGNQ
jgi:hypothetical protein